ncbi:transcriptional regulator [Nocardioides szechwanensis]|uniref:Predicted DNA-binding transcriptional regulator YafY, contains an HTH and WYL domains n=1 Tax=Nocardioides szechwanensis TaxID=1005944 RepID=A0A1G9W901_9ACTN|nr:WYL domain-containing protein [Nocardioides szechwanensis]GEP32710.1 transcriptional regulator [Nocardioides szechwanensis]SDM80686.1 Predicted DNA-binding transcriptional regulator YafY, contains an HTH and WYL domains [Nocardioides szechwanensis]
MSDSSPTSRALLALELVQNAPGISAARLADRLGVSERAARRYVAILREAGVPIESVRGPYGGYRVGRGLRLPPLMFSVPEAMGLVMAVIEGRGSADTDDPVGHALGKIIRVLPEPVAGPTAAVRGVSTLDRFTPVTPGPETTAALVQACAARHRVRLGYLLAPDDQREMDVDPWAVVVRRGRWYLLCWSHHRDARRLLRVDRVASVESLPETFTPPEDLDAHQTVEEHLSEGWPLEVEVVIDAPLAEASTWVRRSLGRLEEIDAEHTRLRATTNNPGWYAGQLTVIRAPYRIVGPPELLEESRKLGRRLLDAAPDRD